MDATLLLIVLTLICLVLFAKHVSGVIKKLDDKSTKYHEFIYNEARRASRISLQCRMEIETLTTHSKKSHTEVYNRQAEILKLLENLSGSDDEFDLSGMIDKEQRAKDILQKINIRQQYISTAIERLEHMFKDQHE